MLINAPLHRFPRCSGIINVQEVGTWAWASYTAVLGAIVAVSVGKDTNAFLRSRRRSRPEPPATK